MTEEPSPIARPPIVFTAEIHTRIARIIELAAQLLVQSSGTVDLNKAMWSVTDLSYRVKSLKDQMEFEREDYWAELSKSEDPQDRIPF